MMALILIFPEKEKEKEKVICFLLSSFRPECHYPQKIDTVYKRCLKRAGRI